MKFCDAPLGQETEICQKIVVCESEYTLVIGERVSLLENGKVIPNRLIYRHPEKYYGVVDPFLNRFLCTVFCKKDPRKGIPPNRKVRIFLP